MPNRGIVVVGGSAGGVTALKQLVSGFPEDLDAAVFVVIHFKADVPSHLAQILRRSTRLPVVDADDGAEFRAARVYVAQPGHHLILEQTHVRLTKGPRENRARPAIDTLFRSAAYIHAARAMGVVLSGMLDDGTAGLWAIKDRGGVAVVQHPDDAEFRSMPESALTHVPVDHVCPLAEMASLLTKLTRQPAPQKEGPVPKELEIEARVAAGQTAMDDIIKLGPSTPLTCPECHGVLFAMPGGGIPRFRCHTGHAYSIETLVAELGESVEDALWQSLSRIEESMVLLRQFADRGRGDAEASAIDALVKQRLHDAERRAALLRQALA
jgi:two-component system, chemotaxis family, protein-glutamate methylesterase/glutaminase